MTCRGAGAASPSQGVRADAVESTATRKFTTVVAAEGLCHSLFFTAGFPNPGMKKLGLKFFDPQITHILLVNVLGSGPKHCGQLQLRTELVTFGQ